MDPFLWVPVLFAVSGVAHLVFPRQVATLSTLWSRASSMATPSEAVGSEAGAPDDASREMSKYRRIGAAHAAVGVVGLLAYLFFNVGPSGFKAMDEAKRDLAVRYGKALGYKMSSSGTFDRKHPVGQHYTIDYIYGDHRGVLQATWTSQGRFVITYPDSTP